MAVLPARVWTEAEWRRIEAGYRAGSMEERWLVFAENDVVYLHRSWTGYGIFEATFGPVEGGHRIVSAVVETAEGRYSARSDELESLMLELILRAIVLGQPVKDLRVRLVELTGGPSGGGDLSYSLALHSQLGHRSPQPADENGE
jgi:hypothetical protein